jgi:hypothetical protein
MTFEADLKAHLQASTAISALVAARIHPLKLDDNEQLPAITYQEIASEPQTDLSGGDGALVRRRVQVNVWAATAMAAAALAELVRVRMQTAASSFSAVPESSSQQSYEPNTKRFGHYRDFSCWYRTS